MISVVEGRIGARLAGKWRLDRHLATGRRATVYRATHRITGHRVAIKVFHANEFGSCLIGDAYVPNQLLHRGVARVHADGITDDGWIADRATGLTWRAWASSGVADPRSAMCDAGRVPTLKELQSLVDENAYGPARSTRSSPPATRRRRANGATCRGGPSISLRARPTSVRVGGTFEEFPFRCVQ